MNQTTTRRHRPTKPVKQLPVELTKITSVVNALSCLNEFVKEARKEIRRHKNVKMRLRQDDLCGSMLFVFDDFSLCIDFTEGITV